MRLRMALLATALTLGAIVTPVVTTTPAAAGPALGVQAQCPTGSYSVAQPPYHTYWHIGIMLNGVRYWHTVDQNGNYVASSITGCSSTGTQLWSAGLPVSATSGDRCDPATSSNRYQYVGEYRHAVVSGPFIYFVYYRYWHVRRLHLANGYLVWLYDHSELARC
ncbi:hypothetical protein [Allorhizocola rhizosphaerae]|uniref:hypothetical protein n=1 Tax=Allorhizocola rhizosphaerae TaxID=1872709 RepID=UPI0013C31008|nr:hypothetical protein [Allorhizocola rhizosphaerae]